MDPPPPQTPAASSDRPAPAINPNPNPNPAQSQEQMNNSQLAPQSQTLQQRLNPAMPLPRGAPPSSGTVGPIQSQVQSQRMAMGVPAPFSSFRPSHPFAGPPSSYPHHPPWTAPGGPEHGGSSASSASQVRQPVPGVQSIGMMGSMNNAVATAQMRASGVPGQNQQRPGVPQVRPTSQSANQTVDPSEKLRPEIEDDLFEIADDFIESIVTAACQLAKHRKSTILEAKDMLLHVERHWNMALPGFTGDEIRCYKKQFTHDLHRERVAMINKSMVGTNEGGSAKNPSTGGQASTNPKAHASKAPAIGSP